MARKGDGIHRRGEGWYVDFTYRGDRHWFHLGKGIDRDTASTIATRYRSDVALGIVGIKKTRSLRFDKAADTFLEWADTNCRPSTVTFYRVCLVRLRESFSEKSLHKISSFDVEKHKRARMKAGARVRANRELMTLRAMVNRLIKLGLYVGVNPVQGVELFNEPQERDRFLDYDEEARLLEACTEPLRTGAIVAIYTGIRLRSEGLGLRWRDVDFKRKDLTVPAAYAKNQETRTIPMNTAVVAALEKLKESLTNTQPTDAVFQTTRGVARPLRSFDSQFKRAAKRAELTDVGIHTLRHTFASRLAMNGESAPGMMELAGWKDPSMPKRYSHLSPSHKAASVEGLLPPIPQRDPQQRKKRSG